MGQNPQQTPLGSIIGASFVLVIDLEQIIQDGKTDVDRVISWAAQGVFLKANYYDFVGKAEFINSITKTPIELP